MQSQRKTHLTAEVNAEKKVVKFEVGGPATYIFTGVLALLVFVAIGQYIPWLKNLHPKHRKKRRGGR